MRRAGLFYTFNRQALQFAWRMLRTKRFVYSGLYRLRQFIPLSSEELALAPDWIKAYPYVSLEKTPKGFRIMSLRNVFTVDIFSDFLTAGWAHAMSQLNPILTIIPEVMLGKEIYFFRPIRARKILTRELSTGVNKALGNWREAQEVTIDGKKMLAVEGRKWQLIRRPWFSRFFREMNQLMGFLEGKFGTESLGQLLAGFKVYEIDLERQYTLLRADADRAYREYRQAVKRGDTKRVKEIIEEIRLE